MNTAAGLAQVLGGHYKKSWFKYYFDEPRDAKMIQYGIDLYNEGF
ncbi:hypothetical protein QS257_16115 [Terrilactibacillus sp. S3-3]|nr:hypothetical protein QS257_16115 [Terrilactibacillus sp. S3-3]